jgi:hypothetical protein
MESILYRWYINKLYQTTTHNRFSEDVPLGSKHVNEILKLKHLLNKSAFCWFILYDALY